MMVPSGSVFLVKPISFSGKDCKQNIVVQVKFHSISLNSIILSTFWKSFILTKTNLSNFLAVGWEDYRPNKLASLGIRSVAMARI